MGGGIIYNPLPLEAIHLPGMMACRILWTHYLLTWERTDTGYTTLQGSWKGGSKGLNRLGLE